MSAVIPSSPFFFLVSVQSDIAAHTDTKGPSQVIGHHATPRRLSGQPKGTWSIDQVKFVTESYGFTSTLAPQLFQLRSTCQKVPRSESSIVWALKKVGMPPFFICHVEQRSCLPAVAIIVAKLEAERIGLSLIDIGPFLTSFRGSSFRQKSPAASLKISAFCFRLE